MLRYLLNGKIRRINCSIEFKESYILHHENIIKKAEYDILEAKRNILFTKGQIAKMKNDIINTEKALL